jgi:hypothetical protein
MSRRILTFVQWNSGCEQEFHDAREISMRMALGFHATVNGKTQGGGVITWIAPIDRVPSLEQEFHKLGIAAPRRVVER